MRRTSAQTIGVGQPAIGIAVGNVTESGAASGETFSVELKDITGLLSATGATEASNDTTDLFINNVSLATLNSDLASLKDTNGTAGTDAIAVTVTDSFGNVGTQTIDVTVAAVPVIAAVSAQTIGVGQPAIGIAVGNVTESGAASGETFSVELKDNTGLLSATGATEASNDTTDLFINNVSLATLNSDLASLKDTNGTAGTDAIAVTVTDSFGNVGTQTIDVTVAAVPVIAAVSAQTIGVGQPAIGIAVGNVTESGAASGETFSVELKDNSGLLSATGATGGAEQRVHDLTCLINNVSLATLNSDLASLKDTNGTRRDPTTIAVTVTDSFGNVATSQTIDVTVAAVPVIAATTSAQTIGVGQPAIGIAVGNVTESGAASGETFSVELKDNTGVAVGDRGDGGQQRHDRPVHQQCLAGDVEQRPGVAQGHQRHGRDRRHRGDRDRQLRQCRHSDD